VARKATTQTKCPEKDKQSKEEWAINKAMMHAQAKSKNVSKEKDN
jgi:hypothetical protein